MNIFNALKRKSDAFTLTTRATPLKRRKIGSEYVSVATSTRDMLSEKPPNFLQENSPTECTKPDRLYYFADGNIIIQSGPTLFRVHTDNLIKLGGVFEELLSLPQPDSDDAGYVDGVPLCPLFGTAPRDVRYLMAYAYGKITPKITCEAQGYKLHWNSAVALLHLSHMLDLVAVRREVIDALKLVFPCGPEFTQLPPGIAGIKRKDRSLFLRTYPLQAINLFHRYNLHALMPMAYYRAAQLATSDIIDGVVSSDGNKVKIRADDVVRVLEGREQLRVSRRKVVYRWLNNFSPESEAQLPSDECLGKPSRISNETCFEYLLRMVLDFNRTGFMDSRHDALDTLPAHSDIIFQKHLCGTCYDTVTGELALGLVDNWMKLPTHFRLKEWAEIVEAQGLEDQRYED